jgi:hypothetical protein
LASAVVETTSLSASMSTLGPSPDTPCATEKLTNGFGAVDWLAAIRLLAGLRTGCETTPATGLDVVMGSVG